MHMYVCIINVVKKILTYHNFQDIFLICYDVTSPVTFENVKSKWVPEIRHICPKAPFILVGTKTDLRDGQDSKKDNWTKSVQTNALKSKVEGITLAKELGAVAYVECSALTQNELKNVFDVAIMAILYPKSNYSPNSWSCLIL